MTLGSTRFVNGTLMNGPPISSSSSLSSASAPPPAPSSYSSPTSTIIIEPRVREASVLFPRTLLLRWNLAMALFHSVLAACSILIGNVDLAVPIYKTVIDFQAFDGSGELIHTSGSGDSSKEEEAWKLVPTYEKAGTLPFTALTAAFFLLSATFHFLNATLLREFYLHNLARAYTPTRWIEYSLSAPCMILLIGYTLGLRDRADLISVAALVGTTMFFGFWTEQVARPQSPEAWQAPLSVRLLPWVLGHVPQVAAWGLIILQFYDGADPEDKAPDFVHIILWGELALFFSFALAQLLSQCFAPKHFWRGELLFQILSLASKGVLGGLLLVNVLMLSRFEDIFE